jgi:putative flavoprotein involved in K+ transport
MSRDRSSGMSSASSDWDAIVVGAGAAGLASAAMLQRAGLRTLILERSDRVGSAWRARYERLRLNSLGWISRLPDDGTNWGLRHYPSREEWVEYLQRYVVRHRLAIRFRSEVQGLGRGSDHWRVRTSLESLEARFVVIATGLDGKPYIPGWPGRESFRGQLLHAAEYRTAEPFQDKAVLVAGANTTGVELAALIAEGGAQEVRVAMRTPPNVMTRHWHGVPIHAATLLLNPLPLTLADRLGWAAQRVVFGDLRPYGLTRPPMGIKSTVVKRGKGPAIDDGFVEGVRQGRIEIVAAVSEFDGDAVVLADASRVEAEVVIAATGYRCGLEPLVGHLDLLEAEGRPRVHAGEALPQAPNLHFVGYRAGVAGPLQQMRLDAKAVARAARAAARTRRRWLPVRPSTPLGRLDSASGSLASGPP